MLYGRHLRCSGGAVYDSVGAVKADFHTPEPETLYRWHEESQRTASEGEPIPEKSRESRLRKEVHELKRLVAKQALEVDFFRGALQKIEAGRRGTSGSGELASTTTSGPQCRCKAV
jgi:hypothetical protein